MPLTYVANPASSFATIGNTLAWRRAEKGGIPSTDEVAPSPFATPLSSNLPRSARTSRDEEQNIGTPP